MTSLWYEILPVTLESDQVVWLRRREDGEAHPWRIAHQAGLHPNDAVLAHLNASLASSLSQRPPSFTPPRGAIASERNAFFSPT